MPQFIATLDEAIPADAHTFVWHDSRSIPVRLLTDDAAINGKTRDLLAFLHDLHLSNAQWKAVRTSVLEDGEHPLARRIYSFIADEIRLPLGLPHEVVRFFPAVADHTASLWLWRSGRTGFCTAELDVFKRASSYLRYTLAKPGKTTVRQSMVEDGTIGVVLLDRLGTLIQSDEAAERLLTIAIDAPYARSFRQDESLAALWRRLCIRLDRLTAGIGGSLPQESRRNAWGLFTFRASWLRRPGPGESGVVAATVTLYVPHKIKLWRGIQAIGLPPRQQEVALLFAEGMSQKDIAAHLNVARTTVIDHVRRLYDRLGIPPDRDSLRAYLLESASQGYCRLKKIGIE